MNENRLDYLIKVFLNGRATPAEKEELDRWYSDLPEGSSPVDLSTDRRNRMWANISSAIKAPSRLGHWRTAAAVLLISGLAATIFSLFNHVDRSAPNQNVAQTELVDDIQPGGERAQLILDDGRAIDLDLLEQGESFIEDGMLITKTKDGIETKPAPEKEINQLKQYKIQTPRGGQYRVLLPDGTIVWLNAASSLSYPSQFSATERRVHLTGEAYFEVAKTRPRPIPFFISTTDQEIKVLGTSFNVDAYDQNRNTTTLLTGSVKVTGLSSGQKTDHQQVLTAGQQIRWNGIEMQLTQVDPERAVAWKNGKFTFDGENIKEIMDDIARWYDVDVEYKGDLSKANFKGSMSKYDTVKEVLRKLALTGTVNFEMSAAQNERRIIVTP